MEHQGFFAKFWWNTKTLAKHAGRLDVLVEPWQNVKQLAGEALTTRPSKPMLNTPKPPFTYPPAFKFRCLMQIHSDEIFGCDQKLW